MFFALLCHCTLQCHRTHLCYLLLLATILILVFLTTNIHPQAFWQLVIFHDCSVRNTVVILMRAKAVSILRLY